jgi:hypothetical protein
MCQQYPTQGITTCRSTRDELSSPCLEILSFTELSLYMSAFGVVRPNNSHISLYSSHFHGSAGAFHIESPITLRQLTFAGVQLQETAANRRVICVHFSSS